MMILDSGLLFWGHPVYTVHLCTELILTIPNCYYVFSLCIWQSHVDL